jgi:hypothetical protein
LNEKLKPGFKQKGMWSMDWTAIGLGVITLGAVAAYITRPWWAGQADPAGSDRPAEALAERQEAVLAALRDLDFDHEVGKVTEEDYNGQRQALLVEVASVITQLDEGRTGEEADLDEQIEAQILTVRQTLQTNQQHEKGHQAPLPGNTCPTCHRPARPGDLYCAGCGARLASACPECGKAVQPTDFYCASCGIELALALSG